MRIDQDYSMYYHDTYIGVKRNNGIHPFLVEGVEFSEDALSECEEAGEDPEDFFSYVYEQPEEAENVLVFYGTCFDEQGGSYRLTTSMDDLVLENPRLGYVFHNGVWSWYTYTTNQSVKKGICPRRLNLQRNLSGELLYKLFNIEAHDCLLDPDLLLLEKTLDYKGVSIAKRVEDSLILDSRFGLMKDYIESLLPNNITLEVSCN